MVTGFGVIGPWRILGDKPCTCVHGEFLKRLQRCRLMQVMSNTEFEYAFY